MSPSLSENVDRKEKLVEAYFYAINETHAKNYSSSVIQELLFRDGGGKEVGHYIKAKNSVELDPQLMVEILLSLRNLTLIQLSKGELNLVLDWITVKLIQLIDKCSEAAAFDYLHVHSRRILAPSRATISPDSWKQRIFRAYILIKTNNALDSATHALGFLTKAYQGASYTSGVKNPEKALIAFRLHRKRSRSDAAKKGKRIAQKFLDLEHSPKK